ncbi:MAG: imidazolonepropionase [Thermotogae bacterium]|nr:imidazolonepropionase [Thermotogota bacterium]
MEKFDLVLKVGQLVTFEGNDPVRKENLKDRLKILDDVYIGVKDGMVSKITRDRIDGIELLDGSNFVCFPGFVDCHTHIPFYGYRWEEFLMRAEGISYMEIMRRGGGILNTMRKVREASEEDMIEFNMRLLDEMLKKGYTTIEGKSGYGLERKAELKQLRVLKKLSQRHPIDIVPTFLGAHAVPPEFSSSKDYLKYLEEELLPEVKDYTEFVDIFCEKGVFEPEESEDFLKKAKEMGYKIRMHADEIENVGAVNLGVKLQAVSVDHLIMMDDESIEPLAKSDTVAVLLPGTSFFLGKSFAPARKILDEGGIVAIASDLNPGSSMIFDPSILAFLSVMKLKMKMEEFVASMTINSAFVLGLNNEIGAIEEGKKADLVLMDIPDYRALPYFTAQNRVRYVVKTGKVVCGR